MGVRRGMVVSEHVGYLEQGIRHKLVGNFVSRAGLETLSDPGLADPPPDRSATHTVCASPWVQVPPDAVPLARAAGWHLFSHVEP